MMQSATQVIRFPTLSSEGPNFPSVAAHLHTFAVVHHLYFYALLVASLFVCGAALSLLRPSFFSTAALRAMRYGGPIPEHVAFIMDGNRRWARKGGLDAYQGHPKGGEKLIESLKWCLEVEIKVVTVYAFSIENFKRPKREVDEIMQLAEATFHNLTDRADFVHKNHVRVRVLGDLAAIPPSVRAMMLQVMNDTSHYTSGPTLNICFAYTARHDIATAIADLATLCRDGQMLPSQISEQSLAACLSTGYAKGAPARYMYPQLLVRTSGETRLSDFLLWESSDSILTFCDILWPDLTSWDFVRILLDFQSQHKARLWNRSKCQLRDSAENSRQVHDSISSNPCCAETDVLEGLNLVRDAYFETITSSNQNRGINC